jgi:hypothetical protein
MEHDASEGGSGKRQCTLLLFVATPAEEEALKQAARGRNLTFERIRDRELGEYHWQGVVGNETVIAIRPARERGRLVMGAHGRLGSAANAIRFRQATGAYGITPAMKIRMNRAPYEPDAPASASLIPAGIHSLALRACMHYMRGSSSPE